MSVINPKGERREKDLFGSSSSRKRTLMGDCNYVHKDKVWRKPPQNVQQTF